jgi:hypothetical protein
MKADNDIDILLLGLSLCGLVIFGLLYLLTL